MENIISAVVISEARFKSVNILLHIVLIHYICINRLRSIVHGRNAETHHQEHQLELETLHM